jgi:hypothetical protein
LASKCASLNPLALFLKPQSPAERLAAQQRDQEKLQRERQLRELAEEGAKARGEAVRRLVGHPRGSKNKPPPLKAPSSPFSGASTQSECCWQVEVCFSN